MTRAHYGWAIALRAPQRPLLLMRSVHSEVDLPLFRVVGPDIFMGWGAERSVQGVWAVADVHTVLPNRVIPKPRA